MGAAAAGSVGRLRSVRAGEPSAHAGRSRIRHNTVHAVHGRSRHKTAHVVRGRSRQKIAQVYRSRARQKSAQAHPGPHQQAEPAGRHPEAQVVDAAELRQGQQAEDGDCQRAAYEIVPAQAEILSQHSPVEPPSGQNQVHGVRSGKGHGQKNHMEPAEHRAEKRRSKPGRQAVFGTKKEQEQNQPDHRGLQCHGVKIRLSRVPGQHARAHQLPRRIQRYRDCQNCCHESGCLFPSCHSDPIPSSVILQNAEHLPRRTPGKDKHCIPLIITLFGKYFHHDLPFASVPRLFARNAVKRCQAGEKGLTFAVRVLIIPSSVLSKRGGAGERSLAVSRGLLPAEGGLCDGKI